MRGRRAGLLAVCLAAALPARAAADPALPPVAPSFVDDAALSPGHVYDGGWEHFVGGGVAVLDCDADGRPDLFAAGGAAPSHLLRNVSDPGGPIRFEARPLDMAADQTADLPGAVTGAYPLDIDSDGQLDLVLLRVGPNLVLRGLGACRFADATEALGLSFRDAWTTAFAATWEPGQRLPTLFFGNYVDRTDPDGPFMACDTNDVFRPQGARYRPALPLAPGHCALSMLVSDWTRTGRPALRIANDRHYYVRGGYEQMFTLPALTEPANWPRVSLWGMGIASRDLTGDGLPEVMTTSMGDQLLQINRGTGFEAAPYDIGTYAQRPFIGGDGRPATGWHAEFGDLDNDGRVDLFIAKGNVDQMPSNAMHDPNNLLMQGADGRFHERAAEAGVASMARGRGAALVDLNGDGWLDIVVVNRRAPMEIWRNRGTGAAPHRVEIRPRQGGTNPDAVGAWVELRSATAGLQAAEITVGGGHAGGQAWGLHFGLGADTTAEARVIWPDGETGAWAPVPVDGRAEITR
ncbi:CRTAC1 family protein [Phaeovulum vinaykumarii]|uniref:Repeat domain-containing protein n=1 Tax=Phaeovulum vinaykumarii TaxID=407234 RepID=A0A1N7K8N0_9RHOB|nr:CRTAC1 family protein [Phaeovulum vinaykumarii]SIS57927.1 Repeat domain-containing protein [Phaeovulum vinaykumarii]SOB93622.1 VCBS repeat protein [Phaeovulum vinaykumarii]